MTDPRLGRWLAALAAEPWLTRVTGEAARAFHLEAALAAVPAIERYPGPIVDVGPGGGSPGIPLAAAFPDREVTLLDANRRTCTFLERFCEEFANLHVVWGRAEEQPTDRFGVAVARALAPPVVAVEWCLPLVRPGGAAILYVGPTADAEAVADAAAQLAGGPVEQLPGLLVVGKRGPTPAGFPRRPGMARRRPLARLQ